MTPKYLTSDFQGASSLFNITLGYRVRDLPLLNNIAPDLDTAVGKLLWFAQLHERTFSIVGGKAPSVVSVEAMGRPNLWTSGFWIRRTAAQWFRTAKSRKVRIIISKFPVLGVTDDEFDIKITKFKMADILEK